MAMTTLQRTHFLLAFGLAVCCLAYVDAQADGNPHHWDRRRRCDHDDPLVVPKCGICEGVGGIPYGDDNEKIDLSSCTPVALPSQLNPASLKRPIWGNSFTVSNYTQVLIGPKHDPLCLVTFPSNSSKGNLCYQKDHGTQVYDFVHAKALRYDTVIESEVGMINTMILHQGDNMWIVNEYPRELAHLHQCTCLNVHEGNNLHQPIIGPVSPNWTDGMEFVGREMIDVEYGIGLKVLDHWALGPHHVWVFPDTGYIQRMYQPFNGLQVFPNGNGNSTVDPSLFDEVPPKACRRGGAALRLLCDGKGFPNIPNITLASS